MKKLLFVLLSSLFFNASNSLAAQPAIEIDETTHKAWHALSPGQRDQFPDGLAGLVECAGLFRDSLDSVEDLKRWVLLAEYHNDTTSLLAEGRPLYLGRPNLSSLLSSLQSDLNERLGALKEGGEVEIDPAIGELITQVKKKLRKSGHFVDGGLILPTKSRKKRPMDRIAALLKAAETRETLNHCKPF